MFRLLDGNETRKYFIVCLDFCLFSAFFCDGCWEDNEVIDNVIELFLVLGHFTLFDH